MREKVWSRSVEEYLPQVVPGRGLIRGYARLCSTLLLQTSSFPVFRSFRPTRGYKLLLRGKSPLPICAISPEGAKPDSRLASLPAGRTVSGKGTLSPLNPCFSHMITPTCPSSIRLHACTKKEVSR